MIFGVGVTSGPYTVFHFPLNPLLLPEPSEKYPILIELLDAVIGLGTPAPQNTPRFGSLRVLEIKIDLDTQKP